MKAAVLICADAARAKQCRAASSVDAQSLVSIWCAIAARLQMRQTPVCAATAVGWGGRVDCLRVADVRECQLSAGR